MEISQENKDGFFKSVESLKKYRRADLMDEEGRSILEELYTDLLPDDFILRKSLQENTTFLIGRKGTGKSTIFLRLEQELRKKDGYLSCYLDTKTIYESSFAKVASNSSVSEFMSKELVEKYLLQRSFIQHILNQIILEIEKKFDSITDKIKEAFGIGKVTEVKAKLEELKFKITNNSHLESIEIPIFQNISNKSTDRKEKNKDSSFSIGVPDISVNTDGTNVGGSIKNKTGYTRKQSSSESGEIEKNFSNIFLKVFQIQDIITEIKEVLENLEIRHLYILLDDFSEIEDFAIRSFVDSVLAPLNNWSDEFIKFKIAAYPNRIYFGKIDPGKVDVIKLDFYNLYSEFDRDKMEVNAIDFTKRIITKRIEKFTSLKTEDFFDTSSASIEEYYEILFNMSMNVPRILGYILSYAYQQKTLYNKKINRSDLNSASQRYYQDKIYSFFETTTHSILSMDEKISALQLKNLLNIFIERAKLIRKRIVTKDLSGSVYIPAQPYSSHFHFEPMFEDFLKTLELNYFISKYNELSDKDGNQVSIYSLNYGLCQKENINWGKPKGSPYRKYFIERPYNYTKVIREFLTTARNIVCSNPDCGKQFDLDEIKFLEFNHFKCNDCQHQVLIESLDEGIIEMVEKIEEIKLLPAAEVKILKELENSDKELYAREIAQEIDYSGQLVGRRAKKLDEDHDLVTREKEEGKPYKYKLTDLGTKFFK